MSALTDYAENKLVDFRFRGQTLVVGGSTATWSAAPTWYVGLLTAAPTDSTTGTEVTGGSYARQAIVSSLANFAGTQAAGSTTASSGSTGTTSNNGVLTYTNMPACTLVGFGFYDASTAGNLWESAALTGQPIAIAAGATVTFAAGQLTVQVDN
jgi:hypothetical protein